MRIVFPRQTVLDLASAILIAGAGVWYFSTPEMVERAMRPLVYDHDGNTFASMQCVKERNTEHLFTRSRAERVLRDSVEVLEWNDLYRFARETRTGRLVEYIMPEPDSRCVAVGGFNEHVSRFDYFFGTSAESHE